MPDEKPKGRITIPGFKEEAAQNPAERPNVPSMRTQEELMPLALRVIENAELMHRFRAVMGSGDEDQARNMVYEITKHAQRLDQAITAPEGTRIVLVLMKIVGLSKDDAQ
jgi:hypothetical protein